MNMTAPIKWGSDFLVPTTTNSDQYDPSIVGLADGRFLVVWTDLSKTGGDTSGSALRGQVFNADGSKAGGEMLINSVTAGNQDTAALVALPDGRFLTTWQTTGSPADTQESGIAAAISGVGGEFLVNTTTTNSQGAPSAAAFGNGQFVVCWTDFSGNDPDIRAQIFTAGGTKSGAEFVVNSTTAESQVGSAVAVLSNGNFVVAWNDHSESGADMSSAAIRARLFTSAGVPLAQDFVVNTTTESYQQAPQVTALTGGRFVVTWTDASQVGADLSGTAVRAQIFNQDGSRAGTEFVVNTAAIGREPNATLAALPDGGFVVVWQWSDESSPHREIRAQAFSHDGLKVGAEFLVDAQGDNPAVSALSDGRFVVAFSVEDSDADVRAQIFDPRDSGVTLSGTALNDQYVGTRFDDSLSGNLGDDRLIGGDGNDILTGAAGADTLDGGAGIDTASYWDSSDTVDVDLATGAAASGQAAGDKLVGIENLIGSSLRDVLRGDDANNALAGLAGDDLIAGDGGDDTLIGGVGNDKLHGRTGDDTAVFHGSFDAYALGGYAVDSDGASGVYVNGPDGYDFLTGIEHLQFDDGRIDLEDGSALFDTLHYMAQNRDVYHAGVNALDHYNTFGRHEGRNPNALFDTSDYLAVNKDVAAAGINPLDHYHHSGWLEGRDPSAWFDTTLYLLRNPDVAAAGMNPLAHYLQFGMAEGRQAYAAVGQTANGFDAQYYLFQNPDVAAAGVDPLFHFNVVGWREGRDPNGWFDSDGYLAHYTDVAAAGINAFDHYMAVGWKEGRDASPWFDTSGYLATYTDVAAAGVNPLDHFLQFGIYEGRQAVSDGVWG
jgi:Ca2+-binding RTX toxin-like protein